MCYFVTNDSMCLVDKSKFNDIEIMDFIDSLANNSNNYYLIIKKSKYFDKDYSIIFDNKYIKDFLTKCNKNKNYIYKKYLFFKSELTKIEHRFDRNRYPLENTIEYNEINTIANIIMNDHITDEYLIITFCKKNNNTWYLRGISFEGVRTDAEYEK